MYIYTHRPPNISEEIRKAACGPMKIRSICWTHSTSPSTCANPESFVRGGPTLTTFELMRGCKARIKYH